MSRVFVNRKAQLDIHALGRLRDDPGIKIHMQHRSARLRAASRIHVNLTLGAFLGGLVLEFLRVQGWYPEPGEATNRKALRLRRMSYDVADDGVQPGQHKQVDRGTL